MLIGIALLVVLSVGCLVLFAVQAAPGDSSTIARRLDGLRSGNESRLTSQRRRRQQQVARLSGVLQSLGEQLEGRRQDGAAIRTFLIQAGHTSPSAVAYYWALRVLLAVGLAAVALLIFPLFSSWPFSRVMGAAIWVGVLGWLAPRFWVRGQLRRRQRSMQRAVPDMLDMLVVCVEAGLGLNQAMQRVADEIDHVSAVLSEQVTLVNLEIRAGTPRDDALRHLADRTGLSDIRTLVAMLIQTDRFGTSVANALRVQSDTLRSKRRQRAEEAAAKTTIKLVFPLVLFVFPAMFIVILGPVVMSFIKTFVPITHQ